MIVIAGQRNWVRAAHAANPIGLYAPTISAIRSCPEGSHIYFVHWSDRVPDDVLDDYVCIGFHMTNLPYGAGGMPLQNLLIRGIYKTVLTAFRMTSNFDAGNVLMREEFEIKKEHYALQIYQDVSNLALRMVSEVERAQDFAGIPQDVAPEIEQFRRLVDAEIPIDATLDQAYDYIRAFDAPGYEEPFIDYGGIRIKFSGCFYNSEKNEINTAATICPKP